MLASKLAAPFSQIANYRQDYRISKIYKIYKIKQLPIM